MIQSIWVGLFLASMVVVAAVCLSAILHGRAPKGGYFSDVDRAASIFSAVGTLFSVLLALVIFLSVDTYTQTKAHASAEADAVLEQFQLASLFPSRSQFEMQSQLICYGRSVINDEWRLMRDGDESDFVKEWARIIDAETNRVDVRNNRAAAGYELFLQRTLERQEERRGRLEGADGTLPPLVWPVLILGAAAILILTIYYADNAERLSSQAMQVGVVTVLMGASLLLIWALDHPFSSSPGQVLPDKMEESVFLMEDSLATSIDAASVDGTLPCDSDGARKNTGPVAVGFPEDSTMARIARRGELRVGVSYTIPLFGELDPISGEVSGFDADLGREIAYELGLSEEQITFIDTPVEDRIPAVQEGRVDIVIEVMTITPERAEEVNFSRPYYIAGQSILVQRNNRSVSNFRDLATARVCTVPTSTSAETLVERSPTTELTFNTSFAACVATMRNGEADAITSDDIILAGLAETDESLTLVGGQFTTEPYGVAVPKGNEDFVEFINEIIDEMIEDGRWGKLYYQYLGDVPGLPPVSEAKERLAIESSSQ